MTTIHGTDNVIAESGVAPKDSPWRSISTRPSRQPRLQQAELQRVRLLEQAILLKVLSFLDGSGAELAVLSRAGSRLRGYRFDTEEPCYTHSGFAVKLDGQWCVDHLINRHESAHGVLVRHSLIDFFRDDPYAYRIGVLLPSPGLQKAIIASLNSPVRASAYCPHYSRLSFPFSTRYQNSNQWLAEIIGAAQSGETRREAIQQYLRLEGLVPTVLRLNAGLQLAARTITSNTRFDDHPWRNRLRGRIQFLVEPSLRHYLQVSDPGSRVEHLSLMGNVLRERSLSGPGTSAAGRGLTNGLTGSLTL